MRQSAAVFQAGALLCALCLISCQSIHGGGSGGDLSEVSSFVVSEFVPPGATASWSQMAVGLQRTDGSSQNVQAAFTKNQFESGPAKNVTVTVFYGSYAITLNYFNQSNKLVYQVCQSSAGKVYLINTPQFEADIAVCQYGSDAPVGIVQISPASNVTLTPSEVASGSGGQSPNTAQCIASNTASQSGFDVVNGSCVAQASAFSISNGSIYDHGTKIRLKGINWFGLEGSGLRLDGLWTGRTMESFVDQMVGIGFNAFRLPLSPEAIHATTPGSDGYQTTLLEIQHFLDYTLANHIYVILDLHTCSSNVQAVSDQRGPAIGVCAAYSEQLWTADLLTLANLALAYPNVVGIDLFNEPVGYNWNDWSALATRAGNAILAVNPKILIFVEGVGNNSNCGANSCYWGENLLGAANTPVGIVSSRLVYTPHVYGPAVAVQSYFSPADNSFPQNMPAIWNQHFGYLKPQPSALAIGEFGGTYVDQDKVWQDAFIGYLIANNVEHFFYWALNPNAGDTGGILNNDWTTVNQSKVDLLRQLLVLQP